ncbi:flavin reductase family protein [Arthrobacter sp. CAU 1506]|uniref:flavin reductase family protein n=1 Tax=Arthrobacter sp. CAU 1506 TaxID=2560052 RepID=UPI0010AD8CB9|nr:flavin reductase family protein [Arthrobacter sp. CAU 1506]TJY66262.1 flavin reductase family protein [Arthrobacter sp. CAU 1506]
MTEQTHAGSLVRTAEQKSYWRQVLGHYPTGITIITSTDRGGRPVGMIVGTFTSVSAEPPLIGFMPQRTSQTFREIEQTGRFRASVLGASHEKFCRDFFSAPKESRFSSEAWEFDAHGIPRLTDSVAWFDATVYSVLPAGDHVLVLGEVADLGLGPRAGAVPLVFLNGGYGTFTKPQPGFSPEDFGGRLRVANSVTGLVRQLTMELGVECALSTVVHDQVVVLAAADLRSPYVGTSFPFAAPMGPGAAAWSPLEVRERWINNGLQITGKMDTTLISDIIDLTRFHGYAISFGHTMDDGFEAVLSSAKDDAQALSQVWEALEMSYKEFRSDPRPEAHASVLQIPIFGPDEHTAYELVVSGFAGSHTERFKRILATSLSYGQQITGMIGGTAPAHYSPQIP